MPGRLQDKVAVITGGNSGIGLATSRLFRSEGALIAVIGRDPETIRRTVAPAGEDCLGFAGDVASAQSLNEFYTQVAARFGRIDVPMQASRAACRSKESRSSFSISL